MSTPQRLSGLRELADGLDCVICDVWGVLHNGETAFENAFSALSQLQNRSIPVALLTNSPRPAATVHAQTRKIRGRGPVWDHVVSSGELAIRHMNDHFENETFYHMGLPRDRDTIARIKGRQVRTITDAGVIVCTGLEEGRVNDLDAHRPDLEKALGNRAQFVCVNPDRYVDVGGRRYMCAGLLAETYEKMGGDVLWLGKPHASAYDGCLEALGASSRPAAERVLCIGDSLKTDIAGAKAQGMPSLFIEHGLHREEAGTINWQSDSNAAPDYSMPSLRW